MGRRLVTKECENKNLEVNPQVQNDEEAHRQQDVLLLRRVRSRLQRTQRNISKLNDNLRFLRRCAISCLDIVDNAVDIIEQERQETRRMLQLVEQDEPTSFSSRRHTVNPMIAGFTLKRATISLKRLAPMRQLQIHDRQLSTTRVCNTVNTVQTDIEDQHRNVSTLSSASVSELSSDEESPTTHST